MRTSQPSRQSAGTNNTGPLGLGTGLAASAGQRLPVPPRERKPALAALAVLLILGGALVSAYLVIQSGQRVSAIALSAPVSAGEKIPENALKSVSIGNTGIKYIRWDERQKVTNAYAAGTLPKDTLLTNDMLTTLQDTTKGRVIIGLSLKAGQIPSEGLDPGQTVALYAVGGRTESGVKPGTLLAPDALVHKAPGAVSTSSRTGGSSETRVSVSVLPTQAAAIAQAASAGNVVVVIVPPGTTVTAPPAKTQTKPQNEQQTKPQQPNKPGG